MNEKANKYQKRQVLLLLALGICICLFSPIKFVLTSLNQRPLPNPAMDADLYFLQADAFHPQTALLFFKPIPINEANQEILSTLPNIGPVLAERIVKKRESLGGFNKLEELLFVKGIGQKKFEKIRGLIEL